MIPQSPTPGAATSGSKLLDGEKVALDGTEVNTLLLTRVDYTINTMNSKNGNKMLH